MAQNYGLGRGLSSLIPQKKTTSKQNETEKKEKDLPSFDLGGKFEKRKDGVGKKEEILSEGGVVSVDVEKIIANPYQPRIEFDENKLQELANSIKEHGVIQPLVVSKKGEKYELIAGERRLQASKLAKLQKVPVIIKNIDEKEKLELAIIENIQRHNLNPIEEAKAYKRLMEEFEMSQEEVAKKMGKSRSVVANKLRLLSLPIEAIKALRAGKITEGHAKVVLAIKNSEKRRVFLELMIKNGWTVRQAEDKVREMSVRSQRRVVKIDPEVRSLEEKFSLALGTKVKIKKSGKEGGKIIIDYFSGEELDKIVGKLAE